MKITQRKREARSFQQPVEERQLCQSLARNLTGETILEVVELASGLFNNTYRVQTIEKDYILKIAPHPQADVFYNERYLMAREQSLSTQLESVSPLVPRYVSFFKVGDRPAFLQALVRGRLWHDVIDSLSDNENARLWTQLGQFAKTLHNCDGHQFGYPAPFPGFQQWSGFIQDNVMGMVEDCHRLNIYHPEIDQYVQRLPDFFGHLDKVTTSNLLHGDLWPRNVIIDGEGSAIHIKAVIDGERAFWGDPISDWVLILYDLPQAFWHGYGENLLDSADPVRVALYKGMYFILNILEAMRFHESDHQPRGWLAEVNTALGQLQSSGI